MSHIMYDSQTSATRTLHWFGGDFSIHSMTGFREYLKTRYTNQELSTRGINDINNFNYRQFLLNRGFTLQSYRNQASRINGNIPLYEDFVYFQRQALNDVMDELFDYIESKIPGIPIGATTNLVEPRGFIFSDRLTYLAGEFPHESDALSSPPTQMVMHYKLAEDLDKTLIFFPYPDAFNAFQNRNSPRQSRGWIAQSYAMGSIFTIPGKVWTNGNGIWDMGWENHSDIYTFVKDHSDLFDDYESVSNVALAYSVYASFLVGGQNGSNTARNTLDVLIRDNISFDMKIFGDPDRPLMPSTSELDAYDVIIQDNDKQYFTNAQIQLINDNSSKTVNFNNNNLSNIRNRLSWKLDVLQNGNVNNGIISTLPRASTVDPSAPYVIHLINRKYNQSTDNATTHNNVSIRVPTNVFPNTIISAKLHKLDKSSIDLTLNTNAAGEFVLNIGTFADCWGMIELIHEPQIANDQIAILNKPTELISDTTYTFEIQYTATLERDIVVSIFNEGIWIDGITTKVNAGSSTLFVEFDIDAPLAVGDNYEIRAMIREVDGGFTTNKDIDQATPVKVVYRPYVTTLNVPSELLSSNSYTFDVSYAANDSVDLILQILDGPVWIGGNKVSLASGEGIESMTIAMNAPLPAGDNYEIRAMIREVGGDFASNIDIHQVMPVEIFIVTATPTKGQLNDIKIFPNPVSEVLLIEGKPEHVHWELQSNQGVMLLSGKDNEIDVRRLPSGSYLLQFSDGFVKKVVRE